MRQNQLQQKKAARGFRPSRPLDELRAAVALAEGVDHTGDEYERAQKATRRLLRGLVDHGEHTVDLHLRFHVRAGRKAGVRLVRRPESLHDDMVYDWIAAMADAGTARIRVCPACGRLFVKITRKEYCSTKCQARTYMRKYREANRKGGPRGKTTRKRGR
jgi:hypothetical protein